jgi:hypothetical protein
MHASEPMPETHGEMLCAFDAGKVVWKEILRNALLMILRKVRRDRGQVQAEYDLGYWKAVLDQKRWLHVSNLDEFLNPPTDEMRIAKIENRYVRIRTQDYYRYRATMLQGIIAEFAGQDTELAELGCGFGLNLFSLLAVRSWKRLIGLEVSENALEAGRQISRHFHLSDTVHFDRLDLNDAAHDNFSKITGKTVFTYYCLEQLKYSTDSVIANIIRAEPRRTIHIEPTTEMLKLWSPTDLASYLYIIRQDYQNNLLRTLRRFEVKGDIRIVEVRRLYYAPTIRHDPTLICWEPVKSVES